MTHRKLTHIILKQCCEVILLVQIKIKFFLSYLDIGMEKKAWGRSIAPNQVLGSVLTSLAKHSISGTVEGTAKNITYKFIAI